MKVSLYAVLWDALASALRNMINLYDKEIMAWLRESWPMWKGLGECHFDQLIAI